MHVCLILEVLKFSATSELRILNVDLNRSSWRIKRSSKAKIMHSMEMVQKQITMAYLF